MLNNSVFPGKQFINSFSDFFENEELRHSFIKDLVIALETFGFKVSNNGIKIKFDLYPDKVICITVPTDSSN